MKLRLLFLLLFSSFFYSQNYQNNIEDANKKAVATNKFILVQFYSKNCKNCTDFTRDFLYNPKYKYLMDKFVVLTIDADFNPLFTQKMKVASVPNIKIIDISGNIIHELRNYDNPEAAKSELSSFPKNTGKVNFDSLFENKNKPSEKELLQLGKDYQELFVEGSNFARDAFFATSNYYFNLVKSTSKSPENIEEATLEIFNNFNENQNQEKTISSLQIDKISPKNITYAHYILAYAYLLQKNKTEAERHIAEVNKSNEEHWINAVKSLVMKYN